MSSNHMTHRVPAFLMTPPSSLTPATARHHCTGLRGVLQGFSSPPPPLRSPIRFRLLLCLHDEKTLTVLHYTLTLTACCITL